MAYEIDKDNVLEDLGDCDVIGSPGTRLSVQVRSYNDSDPKYLILVTKETRKGDRKVRKNIRLTLEEMEALATYMGGEVPYSPFMHDD